MKRILLVLVLLCSSIAWGQEAEVNQRVLPFAEIVDHEFLSRFLEEQFIFPEDPQFTSAAFLDVTGDGFGTNDLLVLYPGEEQIILSEYLPESMLEVLTRQNLETDYRLSSIRANSRILADEAEEDKDPKKALAGAFLGSLLHYYPEGNFKGYIEQVEEDVRITFWGYDPDLFRFAPNATQCIQPDDDPLILVVHKQPVIQSYLSMDGCVVVESMSAGDAVISRVCE